jgi:ribosomal protein L33
MKFREELNLEEKLAALGYPTPYLTAKNIYALHCQECGHLYYLADNIYRTAVAGRVGDRSEIRFICDACENEYAEGQGH